MEGPEERVITNEDNTWTATLRKRYEELQYILTYEPSNKHIVSLLKLFLATEENVKLFNKGCKITADYLQMFIDTGDSTLVDEAPSAFSSFPING